MNARSGILLASLAHWGGAVIGNAGRTVSRDNIGDTVTRAQVYDLAKGEIVTFETSQDREGQPFFSQRSSYLKRENDPCTRYVIRQVTLSVGTVPVAGAREHYLQRLAEREGAAGKNHEGEHTAGSLFVNAQVPEAHATAQGRRQLVRHLIQQAVTTTGVRLVDYEVNGAGFTPEHAFLHTRPYTRDQDVAELLSVTLDTLHTTYGFTPQLEIDIIGPHGSMTLAEFIEKYR